MVKADPCAVDSFSKTSKQGQTESDKLDKNVVVCNERKYKIGGTKVIPDNELPDIPENHVTSDNDLKDDLGVNSYVLEYRVPNFGNTRVIPEDESQDITGDPEKQSIYERNVIEEEEGNVHFLDKENYGLPESGGGKIIPDDELPDLKNLPDKQHEDAKYFFAYHVNDLLSADDLEKQPEESLVQKPEIVVKVLNMDHWKELIRQQIHVGYLSHIRVKRQRLLWRLFEYHHHYLLLDVNEKGMTILHLTTDSYCDMVCRPEVVDFSNRSHCEAFLNFSLGVEVLHRYEIPKNKTDLEVIQERIERMCKLYYVEYSLTSAEKMYCESLVSYVLTGKKDCREVVEFTQRYGIKAKAIIFSVNNFCTFKSHFRRLWKPFQRVEVNNRTDEYLKTYFPMV